MGRVRVGTDARFVFDWRAMADFKVPKLPPEAKLRTPDEAKFSDTVKEAVSKECANHGVDESKAMKWANQMIKETVAMNDIPDLPFVPHGVAAAVEKLKDTDAYDELQGAY